jgi:hypothetical protein
MCFSFKDDYSQAIDASLDLSPAKVFDQAPLSDLEEENDDLFLPTKIVLPRRRKYAMARRTFLQRTWKKMNSPLI